MARCAAAAGSKDPGTRFFYLLILDTVMGDWPLVSVLIPVYNRESMVGTALNSVLAQTYSNLEIIVGDNASTDRTWGIVQEYARRDSRVRCFRNEENLGPIRNWQACLARSAGDWIKFLFSDDWLEADAIDRYLAPLLEHPEAGFSYSAVETHDGDRSRREYQRSQDGLMSSLDFLRGCLTCRPPVPVSPGAALFRRLDVERAFATPIPDRFGLHCVARGIGPDLWLFLLACETYPQVYHVAKVLGHFRAHRGSISISHGDSFNSLCYDVAFAGFLASSRLSREQKRRLNALLLLRMANPYRLRKLGCHNVFRAYAGLFPGSYDCRNIGFSVDVLVLLYTRIKRRLRLVIERAGAGIRGA
jgi:glycosyltransferase involved in cell wall biosynthesis